MVLIEPLSDRLFSASDDIRRARIHPTSLLQLLAAVSFITLASITSSNWALFWLTLGIGFSMSANGLYYSICPHLFSKSEGAANGIIVTFFSASGVLTPFLILSGIVWFGALGLVLFVWPKSTSAAASDTGITQTTATKDQIPALEHAPPQHQGQVRIVAYFDLFDLDFASIALIIWIRQDRTVRAQHFGSTLCKTRVYTTQVHWELNRPSVQTRSSKTPTCCWV